MLENDCENFFEVHRKYAKAIYAFIYEHRNISYFI